MTLTIELLDREGHVAILAFGACAGAGPAVQFDVHGADARFEISEQVFLLLDVDP